MSEKNLQQNNNGLSEKSCFPIMDILPVGKENAISTADLVKITRCTSVRDLQERIALERNAGAVICSGSGSGYWRAKNRQELLEFVRCMEARAKNTLAATRSAKKALQITEGQFEMGDCRYGK
ncbi:hypothetical protein AALA00_14345 [Lachnospiraceae bacterium 46-15]